MFKSTITLFNYLYSSDEYSKTLIKNVEIQPMCSTDPQTNSTQSNTKVLIIVPYKVDSAGAYVNSGSDIKYYLKPKSWKENTDYFTIQNDSDFIIVGDYSHLTDINLNDIKNKVDDLFVICGVKDFSDDLKHFEIVGS